VHDRHNSIPKILSGILCEISLYNALPSVSHSSAQAACFMYSMYSIVSDMVMIERLLVRSPVMPLSYNDSRQVVNMSCASVTYWLKTDGLLLEG